MIAIADFASITQRHDRTVMRWILIWGFLNLASILAGEVLNRISRSTNPLPSDLDWLRLIPGWAWMVAGSTPIAVGFLVLFMVETRWHRRHKALLHCPHCSLSLSGKYLTVITKRHCPNCHQRIVSEPEPSPHPDTVLIPRVAFAESRRLLHNVYWTLGSFFGLHIMGMVVVSCLYGLPKDYLETGEPMDGLVRLYVWFVPAHVIPPMFLVRNAWWVRQNRSLTRCPHCAAGLLNLADLVLATGNCPACGRQVLSDPS